MCCRSERCFRVNCACVCLRCRNCEDCERIFGKGGLALKLAHKQLGTVTGGIVRSGTKPSSPSTRSIDPYMYGQQPRYHQPPNPCPGQGTQLVKQATENCTIQ